MSCVLRYTTQPAALLLNTAHPTRKPAAPMWRTAPGPQQDSLVCDETRTSLLTKPTLTRTTLGQLCVAPRSSRARPGAKPGTLMAQLALQYSALNHCTTREADNRFLKKDGTTCTFFPQIFFLVLTF